MNPRTRSRTAEIVRATAPLAIIAVAVTVLLRFPPGQYSFYPECPIYRYLHIQCPGCGTTRALGALLHGNITEALRLNAFTTLLIPFAALYTAACYRRFLQRKTIQLPRLPHSAVYVTLALAAIFSIVRNLGDI